MEIVGIVLTGPVMAVVSGIYCYLLGRFVRPRGWARKTLLIGSAVVLSAFAVELLALLTVGVLRSRAVLGPSFTLGHEALFLLGVPALGALLTLRRNAGISGKWYVGAVLCALFAVGLVMLQYGVTEALFGIDGVGGPYPGPW